MLMANINNAYQKMAILCYMVAAGMGHLDLFRELRNQNKEVSMSLCIVWVPHYMHYSQIILKFKIMNMLINSQRAD